MTPRGAGTGRPQRELQEDGIPIARKRVARLMREDQLVARARRRFVRTTDSDHAEPIAPTWLERRFEPADYPTIDRAWVGDMTYVPTREGWLFLAVLLDLCSRRVVGWATGATLATALPLAALDQALRVRRPAPGLIQHTDRGSQYASHEYQAVLDAHGLARSMSGQGDCWDHAVAESFFATLEHELLADADFHSRRDAHHAIVDYIEGWYNRERRHSTLGYISPVRYELRLRQAARAA